MKEINVLEILGKNMHDIRFKKNISIQELAKMTDIDIETLMKFESGICSGLSLEKYVAIANYLDTNIKEMTKGIVFEED